MGGVCLPLLSLNRKEICVSSCYEKNMTASLEMYDISMTDISKLGSQNLSHFIESSSIGSSLCFYLMLAED